MSHKRLLERTNHGCYFADCACGWAGGVHQSRLEAMVAWAAHRDGTEPVEPLRPIVQFGPRPHGMEGKR